MRVRLMSKKKGPAVGGEGNICDDNNRKKVGHSLLSSSLSPEKRESFFPAPGAAGVCAANGSFFLPSLPYCCEVRSEESLLQPGPEGDGDDQDHVRVSHVRERGHEELDSAQLLLLLLLVVRVVPLPEPGGTNTHIHSSRESVMKALPESDSIARALGAKVPAREVPLLLPFALLYKAKESLLS